MFQSLIQKTKILSTSLNSGFGALAKKFTGEFKPLPLTASWHDDYTLPNKLPGNLKYKRRNKKKHRGKVRKDRVRDPSENIVSCFITKSVDDSFFIDSLILFIFFRQNPCKNGGITMVSVDTNPDITNFPLI